jgi:hypothetical protein
MDWTGFGQFFLLGGEFESLREEIASALSPAFSTDILR